MGGWVEGGGGRSLVRHFGGCGCVCVGGGGKLVCIGLGLQRNSTKSQTGSVCMAPLIASSAIIENKMAEDSLDTKSTVCRDTDSHTDRL